MWGVLGEACPHRSSAFRVPRSTGEGQGQPWRLPASLAAPWAPHGGGSSGRWGAWVTPGWGPLQGTSPGSPPALLGAFESGGRWPCPAGCPSSACRWPPINPGLMGSPPSKAELSACHARGPAEDDKRAFCLQALSFLLWGDPSPRRWGEKTDGVGGRGRGSPRMLPRVPQPQMRLKARLGTGGGEGCRPWAAPSGCPLHLGRSGGRGGGGQGGVGCGVKGAVSGVVVDLQLSFHTWHTWDHVVQASGWSNQGGLSLSPCPPSPPPVHSGARRVVGRPHVCWGAGRWARLKSPVERQVPVASGSGVAWWSPQ